MIVRELDRGREIEMVREREREREREKCVIDQKCNVL